MSKTFARAAAVACLIFAAGALPAAAAGSKISADVSKPLQEADKAMKANDFATAIAKLHEAQAVPTKTPFDDFIINELLGNAFIQTKDYKSAEAAYIAQSDSTELPADQAKPTLSNTVIIAATLNDWATVVKYGEKLQALGPLDPKIADPLSIAYFSTNQKEKALALSKSQVDAAIAAGQTPTQGQLDIVADGQIATHDYAGAQKTLEALVVGYNSPDDWGRLFDLQFSQKGMRDVDAVNFCRLRILTGATSTSEDYAIGAQAALRLSLPGEAEAMVEAGQAKGVVKAGDIASQTLGQARKQAAGDRASLAVFAKQAAAQKTGEADIKLAETYYGYGQYAEAEAAAQSGMGKGGVKDQSEALIVLGAAQARQGKTPDAAATFAKVSGTPIANNVARLWTLYLKAKH
jgi:tetratricopeptide (TPR) repeat protein